MSPIKKGIVQQRKYSIAFEIICSTNWDNILTIPEDVLLVESVILKYSVNIQLQVMRYWLWNLVLCAFPLIHFYVFI